MNSKLAIYADKDYLAFSVFQNEKEIVLKKNNNTRFSLYFFIDEHQGKITYSPNYKRFFLDQHEEFIGNFWQGMINKETYVWKGEKKQYNSLLLNILEDVKNEYFSLTGEAKATKIDAKLIFSENLTAKEKEIIAKNFRQNNFEIEEKIEGIAQLVVKNYIIENDLHIQDKKFVILDGLTDTLNISEVKVTENEISETAIKNFSQLGNDVQYHTVANEIVDDIKISYPNISSSISAEYERHILKAEKVVQTINKTQKPVVTAASNFASDLNKRLISKISVSKFNEHSTLQARKVFAAFSENFNLKITEIDKIFLIGKNLDNGLIKHQFEQYAKGKIMIVGNDISQIISAAFKTPKAEDEYDENATMFLPADDNQEPQTADYNEVSTLVVSDLNTGQHVKITNFDPRKGKGESMQEFEYLGGGKLKVLSSTRSLKTGDIALAETQTWHQGVYVILSITRNGKKVGKFKTREIRKIEVKN